MLYIFLDESGNFDFSSNGTAHFILSALSLERPFPALQPLADLKYDLWARGQQIEYFHAAADTQSVRDQVFSILTNSISNVRLDSIVIEKKKTHPTLQSDHGRFYRKMFDILLRYVLEGSRSKHNDIVIITDDIPIKRRRRHIEGAIKRNLAGWASQHGNTTYSMSPLNQI